MRQRARWCVFFACFFSLFFFRFCCEPQLLTRRAGEWPNAGRSYTIGGEEGTCAARAQQRAAPQRRRAPAQQQRATRRQHAATGALGELWTLYVWPPCEQPAVWLVAVANQHFSVFLFLHLILLAAAERGSERGAPHQRNNNSNGTCAQTLHASVCTCSKTSQLCC